MSKIKALKKFGQNYLIDKNIIEKIITKFNPQHDDIVVEIGPGKGALTEHLNKLCDNYSAVEIDNRVINDLEHKYSNCSFINEDFLKIDLESMFGKKKIRVIGNIPYNITAPILFKLIGHRNYVTDALLMVQLEVAKRMVAEKRTKDYGILSVLLNYFGKVEIAFKVSPKVFYPKPKVTSAIVHIRFNESESTQFSDKEFIKLVKAAFGNRRKTLKNSLRNSIFTDCDFSTSGVSLTKRAEELSLSEFIELTKVISKSD